jgi:hypothetical protein
MKDLPKPYVERIIFLLQNDGGASDFLSLVLDAMDAERERCCKIVEEGAVYSDGDGYRDLDCRGLRELVRRIRED